MKKFKLTTLLILVALCIVAVGSAALSSVSFERSVSAGQVMLDTDPNVAIQITNTSKYENLVKTNEDGKISLHLNEAISNNKKSGFNTDALFSIGTASSGVIKIKNNSDIPVTVTLTNDVNNNNGISLVPSNNSSATIGVGASGDYYFTINTNNQDALKSLNATLKVEGK